MLSKHIYMVGLPGSGKTTFGLKISEALNTTFIDIDEEVESNSKISISQIFEKYGEEKFRKMETDSLKRISLKAPSIVSTGGGIIKKSENIEIMKKSGIIFFIDRSLTDILSDETVDVDKRPLLKDNKNKLMMLFNERYKIYREISDIIVENNEDMAIVLENMLFEIKDRRLVR